MNVITEVFALVVLGILSFQDLRFRELKLRQLVIFLMMGIVFAIRNHGVSVLAWVSSLLPGMILLIIAGCSKEAVGYGDGIVVLVLGLALGGERTSVILLLALLLTTLWGGVQMVRNRGNRRQALPFVPFLLMGDVILLMGGFL